MRAEQLKSNILDKKTLSGIFVKTKQKLHFPLYRK